MAIRMSVTSKLDGVRSWSLQARETCPGSIDADTGMLVPACEGCYAVGGNYRFPNVKAPRIENRADWQRDSWADEMVAELTGNGDRWFRWFDSGDLYAMGLARKVLEVMTRTPSVQHWLPTRMHKFPKFRGVLAQMQALPNVMVRFSSDAVDGTYTAGVHGSCIAPTLDAARSLPDVHACHAPANDGKCGSCRACYDKAIPVVAYTAHGRDMAKVLKRFAVIVERTPVKAAA
jgi:hypothetical protein